MEAGLSLTQLLPPGSGNDISEPTTATSLSRSATIIDKLVRTSDGRLVPPTETVTDTVVSTSSSRFLRLPTLGLKKDSFYSRYLFSKPAETYRTVYIGQNAEYNSKTFRSNSVSTTKYTPITFLPKFLWEQFSRLSNLFFLFTSSISLIPQSALIDPVLAVIPLAIVLAVAGIKETIEDLIRYLADRRNNNQLVLVLRQGSFVKVRWVDVIVGDILKFEDEQQICADVLLLSTSEPHGVCFVETSSLDGETNLKVRQAPRKTNGLTTEQQLSQLVGTIKCELPNNRLYVFDGTLEIESIPKSSTTDKTHEGDQTKLAIGPTEMILRGSSIQNTRWICAVVINTGHDTKLFKNLTAAPIKQTAMFRELNRQIFLLFSFVMGLAVCIVVASVIWLNQQPGGVPPWYLEGIGSPDIFTFFSSILLISNIIPLGLFIELEISRFIQSFWLTLDEEMYYKEKDIWPSAPSSTLNEELGQISHIFSDKTGTLTQNKMIFRKCIVNGKLYGGPADQLEGDGFDASEVRHDLESLGQSDDASLRLFFTILAVCHTIIPEIKSKPDGTPFISYQASSPDEHALVTAARDVGFVFKARQPDSITIEIEGADCEYEILQVNEFNSTRKRMSVIVLTPSGKIMLYCKGADNVIFERLAKTTGQQKQRDMTETQLDELSRYGFRTLCVAAKEIPDDVYQQWLRIYIEASTSLENRADKLAEAAELIETDLHLVGATAIEDKLQDGVPETLTMLARAGICVWMLTGDKQETAINIALSARLFDERMELMLANGDEAWLRAFLQTNLKEKTNANTKSEGLGLVIDGATLIHVMETDLKQSFLELALKCRSVVCCRVSPLQKAKVVSLVKRSLKKGRTLAIGDGANDVSMIQAAHIGVGIRGEEGGQAARAADYSIGQFRFLQRLLLVHGNWCYFRNARLVLYQFYIEIFFNTSQFFYATVSAWSGVSMYQQVVWTLFYTAFTGVDVVFTTLFDRNVPATKALLYPEAYRSNIDRPLMSIRNFWFRWLIGLCHSITAFVFCYFAFGPNYLSIMQFGSVLYTVIFICLKGVLYLEIVQINVIDVCFITAAMFSYMISNVLISSSLSTDNLTNLYYSIVTLTAQDPVSWFVFLLVPVAILITFIAYKFFLITFRPDDFQLLNEMAWAERKGLIRRVIDSTSKSLEALRARRRTSSSTMLDDDKATRDRRRHFLAFLTSGLSQPDPTSSAVTQATLVRMYNTPAMTSNDTATNNKVVDNEPSGGEQERRQQRRTTLWMARKPRFLKAKRESLKGPVSNEDLLSQSQNNAISLTSISVETVPKTSTELQSINE